MLKDKRTDILRYIVYIVSFGFLFYIMKCCPMINDDFKFLTYHSGNVGEMWNTSLYYGNGRLLGNFLPILLVNHPLLIALQKSAVIFLVIFLLSKIFAYGSRGKELPIYVMSYITVMAVSPKVLQEVFTWFTCFQNYVMPIAGLLISLYLIRIEERKKLKIPTLLVIFLFGFTSQLYLELNTVANIFLAVVLFLVCLRHNKKRTAKSAVFLLSTLLGGALMFVIPKAFVDAERARLMSKYRGVHLDSFSDFRRTFVDNSLKSLFKLETSIIPVLILSVCAFIIISKFCTNNKIKSFGKFSVMLFPIFNIVFQTLSSIQPGERRLFYIPLFITSFLLFATGLIIAVLSMEKSFEKDAAGISLVMSAVSFMPVTIISPFGARCAYLYIFFLFCTAVSMFVYLIKKNMISSTAVLVLSVTACVLTVHIGMSYCNIENISRERDRYIRTQLENSNCAVIEIPHVPNHYMHDSAVYMYGAYYYRENPFDTEFVYTDNVLESLAE